MFGKIISKMIWNETWNLSVYCILNPNHVKESGEGNNSNIVIIIFTQNMMAIFKWLSWIHSISPKDEDWCVEQDWKQGVLVLKELGHLTKTMQKLWGF